jgi:putative ABC transport system permease protein
LLSRVLRDIGYATRTLRRSRGLTIGAVATLAIGLTSVTTVFSFLNALYFRPLPYPDSERIAAVTVVQPTRGSGFSSVPLDRLPQFRSLPKSFEMVSAFEAVSSTGAIAGRQLPLSLVAVDTAFGKLLKPSPFVGRWLEPDDWAGNGSVAVAGQHFAEARFGTADKALNQHVQSRGQILTIVGVVPTTFTYPKRADLWTPLDEGPGVARDRDVSVIAKLKEDVARATAEIELLTLTHPLLGDEVLGNKSRVVLRTSMVDRGVSTLGPIGGLFLAAAVMVLFVSAVNVGNLLAVRGAARETEVATRIALGASRAHVLSHVSSEASVLVAVSGALSSLLSIGSVRLVLASVPTHSFPPWIEYGVDWRILGFVLLTLSVVVA